MLNKSILSTISKVLAYVRLFFSHARRDVQMYVCVHVETTEFCSASSFNTQTNQKQT